MYEPRLISVVFVTYNRLDLLKRTLESFREQCSYPSLELILTDDASPKEIQEAMRSLPFDRHLLAEKNEGLGKNSNKGIRTASGGYILQLQDDWLCRGPADFLEAGMEVFEEFPDVHLVKYRAMLQEAPFERRVTRSGRVVRVYENGSKPAGREFLYSDNPHLKRRELHERLGYYLEEVPMTVMEIDFQERFDAQQELRAAFIEGYEVFEHIGDEQSFNPAVRKLRLRRKLEKRWFTRWPLNLYLAVRHGKWGGSA